MGALLLQRSLLFVGLCVALLAVGFSYSSASSLSTETSSAVVVGRSECLDCAEKNIKSQHAFKGLYVAIKCKISNGAYETIVAGKLNKKGEFKVRLPGQVLGQDGKLKHECVAQVHDVSNSPCPADEDSKLVLKHTKGGATTFAVAGKIPFSSATCTSAFFWAHHKFPGKPKLHPIYKPLHKFLHPPIAFPPKHSFPPIFKKPLPPPTPVYQPPTPVYKPPTPIPVYKPPTPTPIIVKKPCPPPVPVYKPPTPAPVYKPPTPVYKPPAPVYKPPTPVYKPPAPVYKPPTPVYKPPVPVYKPPTPVYKPPAPVYKPPTPVYKPPVPVYKPPTPIVKPLPPPVPVYKKPHFTPHPFLKKPLPPFPYHKHPGLPKFPPIYHKPLPPIYKKPLPPFPYHKPHPSLPKFPPIYHKPLPPIFKKPLPPFPYHKPHPSLPKLPPIYHKPLPPIFKKPFHKDHPFYKKPFPKYPPSP